MKNFDDAQLSKRPIQAVDDNDIHAMEDQVDKLLAAKKHADMQLEARTDPRWKALLDDNMRRLEEIAMKRMGVPVADTLTHAEIVGQWNERLLLTREIISWQTTAKKTENALEALLRRLNEWRKKQERKK